MLKNLDLNDREYSTTDLYFAAFLKSSGVKLLRTERDKNDFKRIYFIFDKLGTFDELKLSWQNDTGTVLAQTYANSIRHLKSICFQ